MANKLEEELAKAAGQIAIDSAKDFRGIVGKIFGPALTEFGQGLGDQVRMWRIRNLAKMFAEVRRLSLEQNIADDAFEALPFGDAVRVIDAASSEDSDDVQALWAQLITNAGNPASHVTIKKFYIDILKSLSAPEVAFLDLLWTCQTRGVFKSPKDVQEYNKAMEAIAEGRWRTFPLGARDASIQNLTRLRCITFRPRPIDASHVLGRLPREIVQDPFSDWTMISEKGFQRVLEQMADLIFAAANVKPYLSVGAIPVMTSTGMNFYNTKLTLPEMNCMLTDLGQDLMRACTARPRAPAPTPP